MTSHVQSSFSHLYGTDTAWRWWRCSAQDMNGEYYPTDNWRAEKDLRPSYGSDTVVKLVVDIYGRRFTGRTRPTRYSAHVDMCHSRYSIWSGPCKSIQNALRRAEAVDLNAKVKELYEGVYNPLFNKTCVYRREGDQYVPFFTDLGLYFDNFTLPQGQYAHLRWDKHPGKPWCTFRSSMERSPFGWSGNYGRSPCGLERLDCWLPSPEGSFPAGTSTSGILSAR